jgi:hypothetical protein
MMSAAVAGTTSATQFRPTASYTTLRDATREKADARTKPGEVGEMLRREGLYTSHLTYWRKQVKDAALKELGRPRGRKPGDRRDREIAELRRRAERADAELLKAKKVIEIQGSSQAVGADARNRERGREHRGMIERTVENSRADHRHPARVPGDGRLVGDDLPSSPVAAAQVVPAAADVRPGRSSASFASRRLRPSCRPPPEPTSPTRSRSLTRFGHEASDPTLTGLRSSATPGVAFNWAAWAVPVRVAGLRPAGGITDSAR